MILLAILKIIGSVTLVLLAGLWLAHRLYKMFKPSAVSLFDDGYILTHPKRKAVAFSDAKSAQIYAERAASAGIHFDIYAVFRGNVVKCGNTSKSIIS